MRILFSLALVAVFFTACKKDKFTTVPQIKYKSLKNNVFTGGTVPSNSAPTITLHVTDAEGDLGFLDGKDTSYVFLKNLRTNITDSIILPDLSKAGVKNFEADIEVNLYKIVRVPSSTPPKKDTLYYDIYVQDFAKNKSNVVRTGDPIYFIP